MNESPSNSSSNISAGGDANVKGDVIGRDKVVINKCNIHVPRTDKSGEFVPHQVLLGKRHKHLRENILGIDDWEMRRFYGFDQVAELEAYEQGAKEFPNSKLIELYNFFFVNEQYLRARDNSLETVFSHVLLPDYTRIRELLVSGFLPYFFCRARERRVAYIVFYKVEKELSRFMQVPFMVGFDSPGSKYYILELFKLLRELKMALYDTQVIQVNEETWSKLDEQRFYMKEFDPQRLGAVIDEECSGLLRKWWYFESW